MMWRWPWSKKTVSRLYLVEEKIRQLEQAQAINLRQIHQFIGSDFQAVIKRQIDERQHLWASGFLSEEQLTAFAALGTPGLQDHAAMVVEEFVQNQLAVALPDLVSQVLEQLIMNYAFLPQKQTSPPFIGKRPE